MHEFSWLRVTVLGSGFKKVSGQRVWGSGFALRVGGALRADLVTSSNFYRQKGPLQMQSKTLVGYRLRLATSNIFRYDMCGI